MGRIFERLVFTRRWYIASALTLLAIIISWYFLDRPVVDLLAEYDISHVDIIVLVTDFGDAIWYLLGSLLLYGLFRKTKPKVAKAALLVFSTTALSGIVINITKVLFGRARPERYQDEGVFGFFWFKIEHSLRSFPSGHATTAIAVWLAFALLFPKYRWPLLAVGAIVSMSRVILTQHYLSDVIMGGYIGAVSTLLLYQLLYEGEKAKHEQ